jgi:type I restriction enzyme M protein
MTLKELKDVKIKNMSKINNQSFFEKNIQRGVEVKIISFNEDKSKITYYASRNFTTSFKNPEEEVRAYYFVELVINKHYPQKRIDFEIKTKPDLDKADIVIYEDDELKSPYLVIECKKDGITDAEYKTAIDQVFRYANYLRAKFVSVIAGTTKTAFNVAEFKPSEREKNVIADIPEKYGKIPKFTYIKGGKKDLGPVSREELIRVLEKSHNTAWQGGREAPTTAFDEVSKLLFCKLKDEKDTPKEKPYKFQVGTYESPEEVFQRIDSIYQKAKKEDEEVFKEDIKLESKIIYSIVEHLQSLALNKIDLDTKGIAFERFMEDFFRGKMGQFFTPRPIIQFCIKMMNLKRDALVLDPACGSGGFLLYTLDNVRQYTEANYDEQEALEHWHKFAMNNIYGIEINDQIARVCKMNMIIHDDGHTNIIGTDALNDFENINKIHKGFKKDHFDLILTNPPFGAITKRTEKNYLDNYILGKGRKTQKSEILFIERCIDFVKPKTGKIAIVLPDGILTNSSLQYVRDFIMERCQILAIVSLPQFTFTHFGAGVKSSLVFLRRKGENETIKDYPIFMALAEHIGYDATGREDLINDLDKITEEYKNFLKNPNNYAGC